MRAREFIVENLTNKQMLRYIKKIHPDFHPDVQHSILNHEEWELTNYPVDKLRIADEDDIEDPYNRVIMVDPEYAKSLPAEHIKDQPIVVDADGYIIDGNHRAYQAKKLGLKSIPAYVPYEEINESVLEHKFNWTDYEGVSTKDRLALAEAYYTVEDLFESNDKDYSEYFLSLRNMSDSVDKDHYYIISLLALINNQIIPLQDTFVGKVLEKLDDQYKIELPDGRVSLFPDKEHTNKMLASTFFFNNKEKFNKFRTAVKLKFNKDLKDTA